MEGLLNIPSAFLVNGKLPGADTLAYRSLRETAEPAWASGAILNTGTKTERTLTNRTARFNQLYTLPQLEEHLLGHGLMPPPSWRRTRRKTPVGLGSNCAIFETARTWAYRELRHHF